MPVKAKYESRTAKQEIIQVLLVTSKVKPIIIFLLTSIMTRYKL